MSARAGMGADLTTSRALPWAPPAQSRADPTLSAAPRVT
jgi:hypothetical protein